MRHKDDNKHLAICDAAIELITTNGFADSSMAKIAKAANVSPATIYVYFENKEDLLKKVYLLVKQELSTKLLHGFSESLPVAAGFRVIWDNFYRYALENPVRFAFTEQFANSPLVDGCREESMNFFHPLLRLIERGQAEKIIKDMPLEIFIAFTFSPLTGLIKEQFSNRIVLDQQTLDMIFEIAWDAVTV
ncbi:MAG: TetR/AcrR family transcriptional regulator [Blastocatellia bacterium]|nr:TetR/AcrR family transcriptional regulator [Blastocatellia bacterium]